MRSLHELGAVGALPLQLGPKRSTMAQIAMPKPDCLRQFAALHSGPRSMLGPGRVTETLLEAMDRKRDVTTPLEPTGCTPAAAG